MPRGDTKKKIEALTKERDALKRWGALDTAMVIICCVMLIFAIAFNELHDRSSDNASNKMNHEMERMSSVFVPAKSLEPLMFNKHAIVTHGGELPDNVNATCVFSVATDGAFACRFWHDPRVFYAPLRAWNETADESASIHCFMLDRDHIIKETCILRMKANQVALTFIGLIEEALGVATELIEAAFIIAPVIIFAFGVAHFISRALDMMFPRCESFWKAAVERVLALEIFVFLKRCTDDFKDTFLKKPEPAKQVDE